MHARAAVTPISYLPEDRPEGYTVTTIVNEDFVVTSSTRAEIIGSNLLAVPGMNEAFGPELRHCMTSREPVACTRFWNGAVWNVQFEPRDDGGLTTHGLLIQKLTPHSLLTLTNLTEAVALVAHVLGQAAAIEAAPPQPPDPRPASRGRLRSV